uniref:Uncharacterized protein n=1 Tax=Arundo donax TaxID=35708 RepID=A0A0A9F432_ARUDO
MAVLVFENMIYCENDEIDSIKLLFLSKASDKPYMGKTRQSDPTKP